MEQRLNLYQENFYWEIEKSLILILFIFFSSFQFYTAKSNLTLCGSNVLRSFDSESSWIRAVFRARHSVNQGGFRIHFALKSDNAILDNWDAS